MRVGVATVTLLSKGYREGLQGGLYSSGVGWWREGRGGDSNPTLEDLESRVTRLSLVQWGRVGGERVGVAAAAVTLLEKV